MILTETPVVTTSLEAAVRAPSPHNTQPWLFEVGADVIDVVLDEDRVLDVCDPDRREARLSCGAALLNLELSLAVAGRSCDVEFLPEKDRPELLARVRIGPRHRATAAEGRLAAAIRVRYSNRRPFASTPVPAGVRHAVRRAAGEGGAKLVLLDEVGLLEAVAGLIRRADHLQTLDERFQAELRRWTRGGENRDGVPAYAGGPRPAGGLLPVRHHGESDRLREFERDPVVAVLTTPTDGPLAQIRAGQAMQRTLLTATSLGLSASFYSQPLEIPSARAVLRSLLGESEHPQAIFRLGYGFPGSPTPRRPVGEVIRIRR
ncbi:MULTISPECIES: Acg family FMN-binding oxidoreductase [Amycolatopsis]|uniref:Acg family FMN-binding oxidoreductase n=1 Tax=Amycolatopsis TaxID=1813 RepID=UPI001C56688C|nr:nitroreductase family protein [Amycolatopsis sp. TNS106]QXV56816.1 nitroreductase [Amycolatopsis sp. TNS106]